VRLTLVTDAWLPQVNGVVTTLRAVVDWLEANGHTVDVIHPGLFRCVPCPGYREIRLALPGHGVERRLRAYPPDRVHIATEGPLGWAAARALERRGWRYTTAFHTRFPDYIHARLPLIPARWGYAVLRRFHGRAAATLVPTPALARELEQWGFDNLIIWTRGVDTRVLNPSARFDPGYERPIFVYAGRVATEKNLDAFLDLDLEGTRVVVGDGPDRARLEAAHPEVVFTGYRYGRDLAAWLASADVFVFPSRTDTYGLVMLEAMACGLPVAAYPVTGPIDVVSDGVTGCLDDDLARAARRCLTVDAAECVARAARWDWRATGRQLLDHTVDVQPRQGGDADAPAADAAS